jgi:peptide methionine sulfoxide reductase msrA/msrB
MLHRWEHLILMGTLALLLPLLVLALSQEAPVPPGKGGSAAVSEDGQAAGKGAPAVAPQTGKIVRTDAEWQKRLTPEQYRIARAKGTERPFTGKYYLNKETGAYHCAACGQELFKSDAKFDSGCGWPSFSRPAGKASVEERPDASGGMDRTEVVCSRCGAHLGHVFPDGPAPAGLRYCINSGILDFRKSAPPAPPAQPAPAAAAKPVQPAKREQATFAAGCFWGVEAAFRALPGVIETAVGYTGGRTEKPTYEQVCTDRTGHAEAVEVVYDPARISYAQLLAAFWKMHDPTQVNRQGPDHGTQYRSAIFYHDQAQRQAAEASRQKLAESGRCPRPIATAIEPAGAFWKAEEYHQRYLEKRGEKSCHL